jgi:broad specificity phosphatase PhoE
VRLLLIRHGQTPSNVRGELGTARPGPGLTPLGEEQARAVVDALAGEQIRAIYVSPLIRTSLTAAPLAQRLSLEPELVEGLEEIEAGDLEDRSDLESVMVYVKTAFGWAGGTLDARMPGAGDGHEFFARFDGAIAQIAAAHPHDTVAVVSHGAAIRVWAGARSDNLAGDRTVNRHLDNTGVVVMEGSADSGWTALTWAGEPIGGDELADHTAPDPTGDPFSQVAEETQ